MDAISMRDMIIKDHEDVIDNLNKQISGFKAKLECTEKLAEDNFIAMEEAQEEHNKKAERITRFKVQIADLKHRLEKVTNEKAEVEVKLKDSNTLLDNVGKRNTQRVWGITLPQPDICPDTEGIR